MIGWMVYPLTRDVIHFSIKFIVEIYHQQLLPTEYDFVIHKYY